MITLYRTPKDDKGLAYREGLHNDLQAGLARGMLAAWVVAPVRYPGMLPPKRTNDVTTIQLGMILPLAYRGQQVDYGAKVERISRKLGSRPRWLNP